MHKQFLLLCLLLILYGLSAQAQLTPPGISEIRNATRMVHGNYFHLSDLILSLGAISGMVGAVRIYIKWNTGEHHMDREVISWFASCAFLLISGVFIKILYNIH